MSGKIVHQSLRDCFAEVFDGARDDPIEHILAITYEFDDQQLLNLIAGRALDDEFEPRAFDLKTISKLAPVVIYDARKTKEANRVPHFMELLPVRMPPYSCHHSKAYMVVTRDSVHLLLGSMNLTRTGLFSNREVFRDFCVRADRRGDARLLADFVELLEAGYGHWRSEPLAAVIVGLRRRLAAWAPSPEAGDTRLLASGYGADSGLSQLGAIWREWMGPEKPDAVFAVSPFFDKGVDGDVFARLLSQEIGAFEHLHVVTAAESVPFLSKRHFGNGSLLLQAVGTQVDARERGRIEVANEGASLAGRVLHRNLHAKILVLTRANASLVYAGSANFTCKAWNNVNRELGVVWKTPQKDIVQLVCAGLHVDPLDLAATLPDLPVSQPPDNEDDYQDRGSYPDFIDTIHLVESAAEGLFHFEIAGEGLERLDDYDIGWGRESLSFTGHRSNALVGKTLFARLLGGRNLWFRARADTAETYFLPFRHTAELFAKREEHLHPSAEDWMSFQLGVSGQGRADPNEFVPGEELNTETVQLVDIDVGREQNAVVRMQRYLSLFAALERYLRAQDDRLLKGPEQERAEVWQAAVATPLRSLAAVILRQHGASTEQREELVFKLGELVILARSFKADQALSGALAADLAERLPSSSSHPVVARYLDFCRNSHGQPAL